MTDGHEIEGNNEAEADPSKEIEDEFKIILLKEEDEAEKPLFANEEEHDNEGGIDKVDVLTDIYQTELQFGQCCNDGALWTWRMWFVRPALLTAILLQPGCWHWNGELLE